MPVDCRRRKGEEEGVEIQRNIIKKKKGISIEILLKKNNNQILAMKEILSNPSQYGFVYDSMDLYGELKAKKIPVDTAITNIASFSKSMGINYKQLKIFNPWLLENHLNNKSRKQYYIALPDLSEIGP